MTKKLRLLPVILTVEIIYLCIATLIPVLPGWKMFSSFERVSYLALNMENSQEIPLSKYLPPTYYSLTEPILIKLAHFTCKKDGISLTLYITTKDPKVYGFTPPACDPK